MLAGISFLKVVVVAKLLVTLLVASLPILQKLQLMGKCSSSLQCLHGLVKQKLKKRTLTTFLKLINDANTAEFNIIRRQVVTQGNS